MSIRVVIADDQATIRTGVRAALEADGIEVVAEAADASGAVAACREHGPDLCLLDVDMPGNGISACRALRDEYPDVAPVMLTVSMEDDDLFDALQAGAVGYLLKTTPPARIGDALRGVLEGEAALPRTLVSKLVVEFRQRQGRRFQIGRRGHKLTAREWDVLELLVDGLTPKEIAERLFISVVTVRTHTASIVRKLDVRDRSAAVDFVRRQRPAAG